METAELLTDFPYHGFLPESNGIILLPARTSRSLAALAKNGVAFWAPVCCHFAGIPPDFQGGSTRFSTGTSDFEIKEGNVMKSGTGRYTNASGRILLAVLTIFVTFGAGAASAALRAGDGHRCDIERTEQPGSR
jgi:hypothetical protein